jgi:uncharacterized membrane-anchored protein YhcB (DUF1043 family)
VASLLAPLLTVSAMCFACILFQIKEQTGINYFMLNKGPNDDSMHLWIYSPAPELARMARLLVNVNFKQQIKLAQAESQLKQMQMDLSSVQSEVVMGMSSSAEEIAALTARIAKLEADYDAAATPEERVAIMNMITAKQNTLTELMRASGNCTDYRDLILCHS